jgi:ankyrin repeat protein
VNWICRHGSGLGFRSPKEEGRSEDIFASVSYQPLALLYAQDMLSAFMWAATKNMENRIPGVVELNYGATLDPDDFFGWKKFTLRDASISKLAEDLQNTGIGSLEECYEAIIPPLSVKKRLPLPHGIVELARRQAEALEKLGNWDRIPDIYIWLFETATSYPPGPLGDMATALILEYMHYAESVLKSMVDQLYDEHESERRSVTSARYNLQVALELRIKETSSSADYYRLLISDLLSLHREHGYCWDELVKDDGLNSIQQSAITDNLDWDELGSKYGHTPVLSVHETLPSIIDGKYTLGDYTKHVDDSGCTWLHYRVHQEDSWELPYNFGRKAELEAPDLLGRTPLHHACKIGMTKAVLMLLRAGAKTDAQARDGTMPLHLAAINGHSDAVAALLEAGASRDPVDASGKTPLLWAALNGHDGVIRLLLLSGASKRARDHVGRTAAHLYALSGKTEFLSTLLEAVDYASKDPDGETPLHLAAAKGHAHTIHLFLPKNPSTAAVDELGRAMCVAAQWGRGEVVSELAEVANRMGFALGFRDEYGPKALCEAGEHGRMDIIKILVDDMGVDVNTHSQEGRTLLHLLAIGGHSEAIKTLLQREGIILDAKDEHGNTPLDLAERNRHSEVASLLSAAINGAVPE